MKPLLSIREVHELTGLSERTLRHWCTTGAIPGAWQPAGLYGSWYIPCRALAVFGYGDLADIANPSNPTDTQGN